MMVNQLRRETKTSSLVPISAPKDNMFSYIIKQKSKNVIILSSDEESDSETKQVVFPPNSTKKPKLKGSEMDPIPLDESDEEMTNVAVETAATQPLSQVSLPIQDQLPPEDALQIQNQLPINGDFVKQEDQSHLLNHLTIQGEMKQEENTTEQLSSSFNQNNISSCVDDNDPMVISEPSSPMDSPISDIATLSDIAESDFCPLPETIMSDFGTTMDFEQTMTTVSTSQHMI